MNRRKQLSKKYTPVIHSITGEILSFEKNTFNKDYLTSQIYNDNPIAKRFLQQKNLKTVSSKRISDEIDFKNKHDFHKRDNINGSIYQTPFHQPNDRSLKPYVIPTRKFDLSDKPIYVPEEQMINDEELLRTVEKHNKGELTNYRLNEVDSDLIGEVRNDIISEEKELNEIEQKAEDLLVKDINKIVEDDDLFNELLSKIPLPSTALNQRKTYNEIIEDLNFIRYSKNEHLNLNIAKHKLNSIKRNKTKKYKEWKVAIEEILLQMIVREDAYKNRYDNDSDSEEEEEEQKTDFQ